MSTGSGLFSFLHGGFAQFFGQIVSIVVKTFRNTNLVVSRCFKMKKTLLPVGVRRYKTPLLKLPNYWCRKIMKRRPYWCPKPILLELNLICTLLFQNKFCVSAGHVSENIKRRLSL